MTRWAMLCMRFRGARMAQNWRTPAAPENGRLMHSERYATTCRTRQHAISR